MALSPEETQGDRYLYSNRFQDKASDQVYAIFLDIESILVSSGYAPNPHFGARLCQRAQKATSTGLLPETRTAGRPAPIRYGLESPSLNARGSGPTFYFYVILEIFSRYFAG